MNLSTLKKNAETPALRLGEVEYDMAQIEKNDVESMPAEYREHLVRLLALMAYAENVGGEGLALLFAAAPDVGRRKIIARIALDEIEHAQCVFGLLEELGVQETHAIAIAEGREGRFSSINNSLKSADETYGDEENRWEDVVLNHLLMDGAGCFVIDNYAESSYAPLARLCGGVIRRDEKMHVGFGHREFKRLLAESDDLGHLFARFSHWYAKSLNFFGPPAGKTAGRLKAFGLKPRNNDELRDAHRREVREYLSELTDASVGRRLTSILDAVESSSFPFQA